MHSPAKTITLVRPTKDAIIRARCSARLHDRLARIAAIKEVDFSDVVRDACAQYASKHEQQLQLAA